MIFIDFTYPYIDFTAPAGTLWYNHILSLHTYALLSNTASNDSKANFSCSTILFVHYYYLLTYIYIPYLVYDIPAAVLGLYDDGRRIARPIALGL